jgi:cell division protein FtsW
MAGVSRADTSLFGRWWWSIDRPTLAALGALIGWGYMLMLAANPHDALIVKQVAFLIAAGFIVIGVSLLTPREIRRLALAGCAIALALTVLTLVVGISIKGGRRWIALPGLRIQPSEFLKPCFAVTIAWLLSEARKAHHLRFTAIALALWTVIVLVLQLQPDVGMLAVISAVFIGQLFISGMPLALMAGLGGLCTAAGYTLFLFDSHVHDRVLLYLHPDPATRAGHGDTFQLDTALLAFGNGGLLGRGPGEGHIKDGLPDAHADFIFAVAGEEFGMLVCLLIIALFGFVVLRGLSRLRNDNDMFCILAAGGLAASFGLQAFINMASAMGLIPTKGMTLPFISSGGSSALAVALGMGMLLALTRRRFHGEVP